MTSRHFHVCLNGLTIWSGRAENQERFPQCCNAIRSLQDAVKQELGPRAIQRFVRRAATGATIRTKRSTSRVAIWRAKRKIAELTSKVNTFQLSKGVHGVLSEIWILRVILTAPNVSGRAMAEAFHLVVGSDRSMVSCASVLNIRSAFLEMWKKLIFSAVYNFIATLLQTTSNAATRQPQCCVRPSCSCPR